MKLGFVLAAMLDNLPFIGFMFPSLLALSKLAKKKSVMVPQADVMAGSD